ncbi:MAG: hypothetical protein ACR9NN_20020 [Nostochopsis sp.]
MNKVKILAKQFVPKKYIATATGSYLQLRAILYSGNDYSCPCCGGTFRLFIPLGINRPNALCPKCDTLERHRVLWLYLQNRTHIFSKKLLHIAPEFIFQKLFKGLPNIEYTSAGLAHHLQALRWILLI